MLDSLLLGMSTSSWLPATAAAIGKGVTPHSWRSIAPVSSGEHNSSREEALLGLGKVKWLSL